MKLLLSLVRVPPAHYVHILRGPLIESVQLEVDRFHCKHDDMMRTCMQRDAHKRVQISSPNKQV